MYLNCQSAVKVESRRPVKHLMLAGLSSVACVQLLLCVVQGDQFELSPATPLLSQAVVLGDRRTFSVYDLTQHTTFGTVHSLNLLIRWKSTEGKGKQQSKQDIGRVGLSHSVQREKYEGLHINAKCRDL